MTPLDTIISLAKEQGVSPDSFKKWKARRCVPHRYRHDLLTLASKRGEALTAADLDWRGRKPKPANANGTKRLTRPRRRPDAEAA